MKKFLFICCILAVLANAAYAQCPNADWEYNNFTNWTCYNGNSNAVGNNSYLISNIVNGSTVYTFTPGFINTLFTVVSGTPPSYNFHINHSGSDLIIPTPFNTVYQGNYSLRLGHPFAIDNPAEVVSYTITTPIDNYCVSFLMQLR